MIELTSEVLLALIAAISGGLGWLSKRTFEYLQQRQSKKQHGLYIDRLRAIAGIYVSMDNIRSSSRVGRVFLFEISNGGHSPRPGSKLYSRAIEVKIDELKSMYSRSELMDKYSEVPLDLSYINIILESQEKGVYQFDVMNHGKCMLQDIYMNEHITYSEIYHIYTDVEDEKMFVMSVATFDPLEKFDAPDFRAFLNTEVLAIKSYFSKYRK